MSNEWNGSLSINNNTGSLLYYAVSVGSGTISVPTVFGTLATGVQTLSNLPQQDGQRIYFSNEKLTESLFNASNPANPSPSGPDWSKIYSFWEYSYDSSGFTWDSTLVEEWSYPIQTVVTSAIDSLQRTYGIQSLAATINQLIAQPSFANGSGDTADLIWTSTPPTTPNSDPALAANSRIIGPEFIWQAAQGGTGPLNLLPAEMATFAADVPWNGSLLVTGSNSTYSNNWDVWQTATDIPNGYTAALAAAASTGPQPQIGVPADFRGFFTYQQEEDYGQVTYGPIPDQIVINPIDTAGHLFGTSGNDAITGTNGNDLISGGHGGDIMSGSGAVSSKAYLIDDPITRGGSQVQSITGGEDTYIYVQADSSLPINGLRDTITDFGFEDKIDLSAVDANQLETGSQHFDWINGRAFSGRAGELTIRHASNNTLLQGDTNGDRKADFELVLGNVDLFGSHNLIL